MSAASQPRAALRHGSRLAMTAAEMDAFLAGERFCRVATAGPDGDPHVSPLWFAWDGAALWLCSLVSSRRFADLTARPRVAVVVDAGDAYGELRGVEIRGTARVVGPAPWDGVVTPDLAEAERLFTEKYPEQRHVRRKGRHAWIRVEPEHTSTWDFRKSAR
ncbi:pyridoxamine 5'-phosphate oxidase family protein [Nonomuraea sp. C10]|uniref:pyridoxamine 5'-phosphate oxidase family protein n=1 Tax=Nonomuraea sp. C10 TaxID=2600577 RepID=UPI001C9C3017|nr:pyridoxamine 5'-phosphate oxidase family protein [Nonomuraea sp. C10]